jgi:hypothetical protein
MLIVVFLNQKKEGPKIIDELANNTVMLVNKF